MGNSTLLPTGGGTLNQFSVFGTRPSAIQTMDDASTYVWSPRNSARTDRILMDNLPAEAATISQVQARYRGRRSGTGDATNSKVGFFEGSAVWGSPTDALAGWVTVTRTIALAPGSVSWTVANVNSAQLTVSHDGSSTSGNAIEITYYAGLVTYEVAKGGGFFFVLGCLALGSFLCQADFERYLDWREVYRSHEAQISRAERADAWADVRAYRHPTFFLPVRELRTGTHSGRL